MWPADKFVNVNSAFCIVRLTMSERSYHNSVFTDSSAVLCSFFHAYVSVKVIGLHAHTDMC